MVRMRIRLRQKFRRALELPSISHMFSPSHKCIGRVLRSTKSYFQLSPYSFSCHKNLSLNPTHLDKYSHILRWYLIFFLSLPPFLWEELHTPRQKPNTDSSSLVASTCTCWKHQLHILSLPPRRTCRSMILDQTARCASHTILGLLDSYMCTCRLETKFSPERWKDVAWS